MYADTPKDYAESRWTGVGIVRGRVAHLVFVQDDLETIRIISLRKATSLNVKNSKKPSRTDWKRIDAMRDEDIDFSDAPELGPDFFKNAIIWPGPKKQITLRVDPDVLKFFRKHGRGYQTTMNAVLRKYMEARKERAT